MSYAWQIKRNQMNNARMYGGNYGAFTDKEGKSWLQQQRERDPNFIQNSDQSQWSRDAYYHWKDQEGGGGSGGNAYRNLPTLNDLPQRGVTANALPGYTIGDNGLLLKNPKPQAPQFLPTPQTGRLAGLSIGRMAMNANPTIQQTAAQFQFATKDQVLGGQAGWTDQSVDDRKKMLADPNFYKNNEITKYTPEMQQQILADPSFDWKQVPAWQKAYFEFSSSPTKIGPMEISGATKMGIAQGLVMGLGNPGGAVVGGVLGSVAEKAGYDQTKEWWQQGEGKFTFDKQQVKDSVAAGFGLMNWAAEQAEKTAGLGVQVAGAIANKEKYGSVSDVLTKEGWNAGSVVFEEMAQHISGAQDILMQAFRTDDPLGYLEELNARAPKGSVLEHALLGVIGYVAKPKEQYLGAADKVQVNDKNFMENMADIRERVKNGEDYRVVMTELQGGVAAQIGDMVGQGVADPLNVMGSATSKVGETVSKVSGNDVAAEAFRGTGGLTEAARKYKTLVQTGQAMTIDPNFKVDQMGRLSRMIAGVTSEGEVRAGSLVPRNVGLLDPEINIKREGAGFIRNTLGLLKDLTEQTPHSRAQTGAGMFYENLSTMMTMFDDPHEAGRYLTAIAKGDNETWSQLGSKFANSPEFYTVLPALKAFDAEKLQGIIQTWDMTQNNRDMLTTLSGILGEEPAKLLDDLARRGTDQQDFARMVERLQKSTDSQAKAMLADVEAGRFTAETLKQMVDVFDSSKPGSLPWHPAQWKALMMNSLGDHFDSWVTERLMLDKSKEATSAFFRTTALMKQAQSILLLGGSPGYAITNGLSNMVHRAATGIYGYLLPNQINSFMDRMGVAPARFEEGVGIGGQVEMASGKSNVKTEAMDKAIKGKGPLTTAKNNLSKLSKWMPFSKLSSWFEKNEGRQAFTIGMKQFWSQSWRRGVGFSKMTPELTAAINGLGVRPERIYAAIEAGMNQGEIEKALFGRQAGVQARSLVNDAAQKTGVSAAQAADMLDKLGILDNLDLQLKGKTTADGVRAAFDRVRKQAKDYADMQAGEDLKAIAESVKQKVGLEGATTALDVVQKANGNFTDAWLDHYARFGEIMTDLKLLEDPAQRSKAIDFSYQLSDEEFRRVYSRHAANYQGIFEAWGMSGNLDAINMLAAIGDVDNAMGGAYRQMRDLRKGFFEKWRDDMGNPASYDEWAADDRRIATIFKQAFEAKKQAEIKQGAALSKIYESLYGPAAGEAAHQWWEDVVKFNDEINAREKKMRDDWAMARAAGVPKDLIDAQKQKYYSETKQGMIVEADRINGEGIARLERVIKGGGGTADSGGSPSPSPTPLSPSTETSPQMESNLGGEIQPTGDAAKVGVDEVNTLLTDAGRRKSTETKAQADKVNAIWDVASTFTRDGLPYDRTKFQDDRALVAALRKPEYGGVAMLTSLSDPRLTPEMAQGILERRQTIKEAQALAESFDFDAVQEVPFDQALWQTEFTDTIQRADLTRMYELIGDFPEELSTALTPDGETYVDFMSRVADETAARVEADARDQAVAEHATRAGQAIVAQETRAEAVTTRQLMKEKFQEVFDLSDEQAGAYMELSDALAGWVSKATGENPDAFYSRYYADVRRTEDGGRGTVGELHQAYGRIEIEDRSMTRADAENYARMLVRGGEGELRSAIRNEANKADRIAILDEAYKLDSKMAEGVAKGEMDILFQESGTPTMIGGRNPLSGNRSDVLIYDSATGEVMGRFANEELAKKYAEERRYNPSTLEYPTVKDYNAAGQKARSAKGAVTFDADGIKASITAFEAADFTTLVHENGHVFRRVLSDVAERTGNAQIKADLATMEDWAGVKDGVWAREHEEKFARGFEEYVATGKAPLPKLQAAFEMIRTWMLDVYKTITGSAIDMKISDDVRAVFDRMLGAEGSNQLSVISDQSQSPLYQRNLEKVKSGQPVESLFQRAEPIETPEFKRWFGDSKVVDENGRPLVVYHGKGQNEIKINRTIDNNVEIERQKVWDRYHNEADNLGVEPGTKWDTLSNEVREKLNAAIDRRIAALEMLPDPEETYTYSGAQLEGDRFREGEVDMGIHFGIQDVANYFAKNNGAIIPVYLKIENLKRLSVNVFEFGMFEQTITGLEDVGALKESKIEKLRSKAMELQKKYDAAEDPREIGGGKEVLAFWKGIRKSIKKEIDGFVYPNRESGRLSDSYMVFNPEQIKSTANRGTFDPENPNILFQEADQPFGSYDAASQFRAESEVMDAGWAQSVSPLLKNMEEVAIQQLGEKSFDFAQDGARMSPEGQKMLKGYMKKVQNEMATTKLATIRHAEQKRDFAMLNYSKRYGFDRVAEVVYPYQFYQTRTMVNWAARALDKPAIFSNYARLHNQMNRYERDIPERLRGKIKINAPWLPDWMGDGLYIDPIGSLFPPATLLKPFERMTQQHTYQQIEAERVLQEWAADGRYSEAELQQAVQTQSGTVYERAFAEAQVRRESEVNNPVDFMNTMFGPAWYLTTPYKLASGKANEVTSTPLANTARAMDTVTQGTWAEPIGDLIGLIGKPEEMLKKKLGIPEFGEYGDYYIDRQLANMVAEGLIDSEQAQIAMIERQGENFAQAQERVKLELAMRVPTAGGVYAALHEGSVGDKAKAALTSLFGAGLLPAGELEYRGLKQEWNEAWKRRDAGDKDAINNFFEEHPEYESYLAKGKEPEERLKSFLIGQIWDGYMGLGETNQKQASAEMGETFKQSFLDKETRSYDTLDVDTLTQWAQMLNKKTPSESAIQQVSGQSPQVSGSASQQPLDLFDPSVTGITDQFFEQRSKQFPNYYEQQAGYYALATKGEKAKYLASHPEYKKYLNWKDGWYDAYPQYKPVFNGQAFKRVDTSGWPPMLEDYVRVYAYTGQRLPSGAYKSLEQIWITEGQPMDDFQSWLDSQVTPAFLYSNR